MNTIKKILINLVLIAIMGTVAKAQLNPLSAQYYTNQYLINPALAGFTQGIKINAAYRKLWNNVPGAPLTQNITADYGFKRVGLGLNVYNEKAGLLGQTRVLGSYAYHLPVSDKGQQLNFGISLGFLNQRLETADINGDPNDPSVGQYNDRKTYLDGDFGAAYTSNNLNVQASLPNLKAFFKKDQLKMPDVATFYTAVSYKIDLNADGRPAQIEPKVAFRGVKNHDNIWDAGAQLSLASQQIFLMGLYHSTKNATFGLGMDYQNKYLISGTYTTQTSALANYTNGSFELDLRISFK